MGFLTVSVWSHHYPCVRSMSYGSKQDIDRIGSLLVQSEQHNASDMIILHPAHT